MLCLDSTRSPCQCSDPGQGGWGDLQCPWFPRSMAEIWAPRDLTQPTVSLPLGTSLGSTPILDWQLSSLAFCELHCFLDESQCVFWMIQLKSSCLLATLSSLWEQHTPATSSQPSWPVPQLFYFFSWNFCFLSFRATNYRHMELFDNFSKLVSDFSFFNIFFCVFMDYFLAMSSSFFIFSSAMSNLFLNHQYIFYFTCSFHHLIFNFVFFIFYNSVHIFEHMDCSHTYCVVIFLVSTFQYLCQLWISFNWLTFSLIMGCIFLHLWIYDTFGLYSRHCEFYIIVYWTYLFSYK